jgi:hypothetical protein
VNSIIRELVPGTKLEEEYALEALSRVVPAEVVRAVIAEQGISWRWQKLPPELVLQLGVAMSLWPREELSRVLGHLLQGLRLIGGDWEWQPATKGAICQARYHLGVRPVAALYHRLARPLAGPETPGAHRFGLHLVALDGTTEPVPDTPANRRYFGVPRNQHGEASFPQVRAVSLTECGTHAILDAGFWPYRVSEHVGARRLVRSVRPGMLVLLDKGLYSADLITTLHARGAHVLGRVPSAVRLEPVQSLPDGSFLAWLTTGHDWQRARQVHLLVRVIEYVITDSARSPEPERHRLVTTLLDPELAPALDLVEAYHERWEAELVIDELDTHQRQSQPRLRSQKPLGVLQELYGLLIAHFAVRALMAEAAASGERPLPPRRLSFVRAVQVITTALIDFQLVTPAARPLLHQRLLGDLRRCPLPPRADRLNPRVRRPTRRRYPPKRSHHSPWPQPSCPFRQAVLILRR